MGDADASRRSNQILQIGQVTNVLDALDQDLTNLHDTVLELEQRTLRALSVQLEGYTDFRRFFLAMNLVILPLIFAAGLGYSLQETVFPCGTEIAYHERSCDGYASILYCKEIVQSTIMVMLSIAGSLGIPLYLGTLWAIYSFRVSEEISEEISHGFVRQLLVDNEDSSDVEEESEGEVETSDSVAAMNGSESNETIRGSNQDINSASESKSQSDVLSAKKSSPIESLVTSEVERKQANKEKKLKVHSETKSSSSDDTLTSYLNNS